MTEDFSFDILSFEIPVVEQVLADRELRKLEAEEFVYNPPFIDPFEEDNGLIDTDLEGIWADLRDSIKSVVKKDGIKKNSVVDDQTEDQVFDDAVSHIYYDVADFYEWYFNPDDDRRFILLQTTAGSDLQVPPGLRKAVKAVVDDNLDAMREVDEIPAGKDVEGLDEELTDALSQYILHWQDWYYDRKREEEIDAYFEQKSFHDDIYRESSYGSLGNLDDDDQFDGVSDVPYISEEL